MQCFFAANIWFSAFFGIIMPPNEKFGFKKKTLKNPKGMPWDKSSGRLSTAVSNN
jgi:hypothetical protein